MIRVRSLLIGCLAFCCYLLNTLFWLVPIILFSIIKLLPITATRRLTNHLIDACASGWITVNNQVESRLHPVTIHVQSDVSLSPSDWYMVIANHQSWVDILILQRLLNRKIPFLKFFLKQQLIFVPLLGMAWWALDFPFMKRYSTAQLKKKPHLKGKDIAITRRACQKFKTKPVSIMNFVEGTRFNSDKHQQQSSPYQHLLRPKAGGLAFALSAMDEHINKLINVTIYYSGTTPSYWQYISGQCDTVYVDISVGDITANMRGDYLNDRQFKRQFQHELNDIWQQKDIKLDELQKLAAGIHR